MAPAWNLLPRPYDCYGTCLAEAHLELHQEKASVIPNLMADEGLRRDEKEEGDEEAGTSSREGDESYEGWLELGISSRSSGGPELADAPMDSMSSVARRREELMELNLFSDRPPVPHPILRQPLPMSATITNIPVKVPRLPAVARGLGYRWEALWGSWSQYPGPGYRWDTAWGSPSQNPKASTSTRPMMTAYNSRQFQCPSGISGMTAGSGEDTRVVSPPTRPQIGVWFKLRAAQNQVKEPFLPQIPKSYLRIKDGSMTVGLLMKYLANKLGLDHESEVFFILFSSWGSCLGYGMHV